MTNERQRKERRLTELVWGAGATVLIVVSQLPRVGGIGGRTKTHKGDVQRLPTRHPVAATVLGGRLASRPPGLQASVRLLTELRRC